MHHKRNRTTRREIKRLDTKAFRQASKKAMSGRSPQNPPQDKWGYRAPDLPLLDSPSNGPSLAKNKKRAKKAATDPRCPNGQHEWYQEIVREDDFTMVCPHDIERGFKYYYYHCECPALRWTDKSPFEKVQFERCREQKTCIHCWKVRVIKKWTTNPFDRSNVERPYYWRTKKQRKIRTQDLVSGMTVAVR